MAVIVPRWEWRTFATWFGSAEAHFDSLEPLETKDSDELYFLAPRGANVKVRDDLLDIKTLEEVDSDGLERWMPVMKQAFPMNGTDLKRVFDAMAIPTPHIERDVYSFDQLLHELIEPAGSVRAVKVHKHRVRYMIGGCMAERTDVVADGQRIRTIAVESEAAADVAAAVRDLGLDGYLNTSYPQGLDRALDEQPDRVAVIDVGTNSVKFHLGERGNNGDWRTVVDRADVTRLGEGLARNGVISPGAMARTSDAIADMVDEAKDNGAMAIVAVGTAGMRIAENSSTVVAAIEHRTGVTLEVIPGEEEGRLAYVAAQASLGLGESSIAVFDTGGGSSQFTFGEGSRADERFSVNVGAAHYTEQFRLDEAVSDAVLASALDAISRDLHSVDGRPRPDVLVGMGGAITNMTAVSLSMETYDPEAVQGSILTCDEVDRQIQLYRSKGSQERRSVVGLQPNRAGVILAGASIVRTVMEKLSSESLVVSDRGLRHGLLLERFSAPAHS
jgi:exopolyphosphatase/guanosine-5'-triphosphate,3'-diphosphate pyrophosphatase